MNTMCAVPLANHLSSRRVSSFKDSSALLNNCELHESEALLIASTLLAVYI